MTNLGSESLSQKKRKPATFLKTSLLAFTAFAIISVPAVAYAKRALVTKTAGQKGVEKDITELMAQHKVPGASIALIHDRKIAWQRGFGVMKKGTTAVHSGTLFQAASISKTITAFATMRLVEKGSLNLDTDVNQLLDSWQIPPSYLSQNHSVTLRGLMSHTAGINVGGFDGYVPGIQVPNLLQVLEGTSPANSEAVRVKNVPGEKYEYSGGGFTIIQQLLIDQTHTAFPQLIKHLVLGPLRMQRSSFDQPLASRDQAKAAFPHDTNGMPLKGGAHTYPELAAAGLWTSAPDLARFAIAIQSALKGKTDSLLSAANAMILVSPVKAHSAMGLEQYGEGANAYFVQTGSNEGYKSVLLFFPDGNGIVIMTNSENGYKFSKSLIPKIAKSYNWNNKNPTDMFD